MRISLRAQAAHRSPRKRLRPMRHGDAINTPGKVKVSSRQPAPSIVRRDREPHPPPPQINIRMVADQPLNVRHVHDQRHAPVIPNAVRPADLVALTPPTWHLPQGSIDLVLSQPHRHTSHASTPLIHRRQNLDEILADRGILPRPHRPLKGGQLPPHTR